MERLPRVARYIVDETRVEPRAVAGIGTAARGIIYDLCTEQNVDSEALVISLAIFHPGYATVGHGAHPDREHAYYILSGEMTIVMEDEERVAKAGQVIFFPRGVVHDTRNDGSEDVRLLIVRTLVRSGPIAPAPNR